MNPYICMQAYIHIYEPIRAEEYRTEVESTPEGINSRQHDIEEWISDLEDRIQDITQSKQQKYINKIIRIV